MYRIATHLTLNWIRDHGKDRNQEVSADQNADVAPLQFRDGSPTTEQVLVQDCRYEEIRRAVRGLPDKQRAAVLMHKYQEMDYSQIATALHCSNSAVKSLLFRAYETLRERLAHLA